MFIGIRSFREVSRLSRGAGSSVSRPIFLPSRRVSSNNRAADRIKGTEKNLWATYAELASVSGAVNIGTGFPDYPPPKYIFDCLGRNADSDKFTLHQYARGCGQPRLVNAIASLYGRFHNRELNPHKEGLVTAGATESLTCCFQGLVNPGDEVIVVEPFYNSYEPMITVARGKPVFVSLCPVTNTTSERSSADLKLDLSALESAFSSKTKLFVLNNPNNPTGKVFKREELECIADLCIKHDVVCVADEVYEWMIYPGAEHIRIATIPNMWDRTITISSAGKTFSTTGWRIGWSIGPEHLLKCLTAVHQNFVYSCCTPLEEAVASALEIETARLDKREECYLYTLSNNELLPKRDRMASMLKDVGMVPTIPDSGYFMLADWSALGITNEMIDDGSDDTRDEKFCKWLTKEKKLAAIPPSPFYGAENKALAQNLIRLCFFKKDETIDTAGKILRSLFKQ